VSDPGSGYWSGGCVDWPPSVEEPVADEAVDGAVGAAAWLGVVSSVGVVAEDDVDEGGVGSAVDVDSDGGDSEDSGGSEADAVDGGGSAGGISVGGDAGSVSASRNASSESSCDTGSVSSSVVAVSDDG
jgi:hypothetical protein